MSEPTQHREERTNSPSAHVIIHDKSGLYVAVVALIVSCLCFGYLLIIPSLIDSKVGGGVAEAKASMGQQVADAKATALMSQQQLVKTQTEYRLIDNDWQQMNAFLSRHGVVKDDNGFYTIGKEE